MPPHKHHHRQDHEERGRHHREYPDHGHCDSPIYYMYDNQYQGYHGQVPNKRADPMESIRYGPQNSDKLSSQYSRSVGDDFLGEYGQPISLMLVQQSMEFENKKMTTLVDTRESLPLLLVM